MLADGLVVRDVEVMKLRAVVVADEPSHLLEMLRLDLDDRRGAETVRLLTARDECLTKLAANRFAAVETQVTRTRCQAEELVRPRRSKPLKRERQRGVVEVIADGSAEKRVAAAVRARRTSTDGDPLAVRRPQPAVVRPDHLWIAVSRPSVQRPRLRSGRPQRYTM